MMKIAIVKTVKTTSVEEIDVQFPVLLKSSDPFGYHPYETVHRVDEDGTYFALTKRAPYSPHEPVAYEIATSKIDIKLELAGLMAGAMPIDEAVYLKAVADADDALRKFRVG